MHIKKIITMGSLVLLVIQSLTPVAFAQEATNSASSVSSDSVASSSSTVHTVTSTAQIGTQQSENNPFDENTFTTTLNGSSVPLSTLINSSLSTVSSGNSAGVKQPVVIETLAKKNFKPDENVQVTVSNAAASDVQIAITDPTGKPASNILVDKTQLDTQTIVSLVTPHTGFKPGKYTLTITSADGTTSTQNFTWGVLALNTNKSLYLPGETAQIAMAVLNDQGNMVCDAKVVLRIQNQESRIDETLSTDNGKIIVSPQCLSHTFSLTPDYTASFSAQIVGSYDMTLTATTQNGTYTISDTLQVVQSVPFDVERITATRLYPANRYPVTLHVKANQDFTGTIADYAPGDFDIQPATGGIAYDSTSLIVPTATVQDEFGVPVLSLATPFSGNHKIEQGFGDSLTDPEEKAYYEEFGLSGHDGVDFAMNSGVPVLATDDGQVVLAGDSAYGITVVIQHSWGKSYYGHLSKTEVTVGQTIKKGQELGLSGMSGHVTGPHLHFGIKPKNANSNNGFYGKVDPMPFLTSLNAATNVLGISTSTNGAISQKIISWNVHLKKGDTIDLSYSFKAPPISPQFYTLGPLTFSDGASQATVFKEAREWQLAIDANSTVGPNNCGTGADAAFGGTAWTSPGNACSNRKSTSVSIPASLESDYLQVTNFGFTTSTIPSNAIILGIQFSVPVSTGTGVTDISVLIIKGGTMGGTDHNGLGTGTTPKIYGSSSDLWGLTWTPADITASNFGVAISYINNTTKSTTVSVSAFVTATITYNTPPNIPTSQSPTTGSTTSSNVVDLKMTSTDPGSDNVQYVINLYSGGTCSGSPTTYDQGTSQTGWIGTTTTCSVSGDCYASGTQGDFHLTLTGGTQYSWTVAARDPLGSNTLSTATSCINFTTGGSAGPTLDQLLRHGEWFNSGKAQPFTF